MRGNGDGKRKVPVIIEIKHEATVPKHWDDKMVEFHFNGSLYCLDNLLRDVTKEHEFKCVCPITMVRVETKGRTMLEEIANSEGRKWHRLAKGIKTGALEGVFCEDQHLPRVLLAVSQRGAKNVEAHKHSGISCWLIVCDK